MDVAARMRALQEPKEFVITADALVEWLDRELLLELQWMEDNKRSGQDVTSAAKRGFTCRMFTNVRSHVVNAAVQKFGGYDALQRAADQVAARHPGVCATVKYDGVRWEYTCVFTLKE